MDFVRKKQRQIGRLGYRIEIWEKSTVKTEYLDETETWAKLSTIWAGIEALKTNDTEQYESAQLQSMHRRVFVVRSQAIVGISEINRIKHDGIFYDIAALDGVSDGRNNYTRITAEKRGQENG